MIYWAAFSWEAFATLATGLAAVGAAVVIGMKQAEIQRVQAGIQSLALKSDLFDRRYSLYDRVKRYLIDLQKLAGQRDWDCEQQFLVARGEAQFLFHSSVVTGIDEIWNKACEYCALRLEMEESFAASGSYGIGNPNRQLEARRWFHDRLQTLPDLFHEMKLGG